MDKQTIIGFVLIALVLVIWIYVNPVKEPVKEQNSNKKVMTSDTLTRNDNYRVIQTNKSDDQGTSDTSLQSGNKNFLKYGKWFENASTGVESIISVKTDLYSAEFTSFGGGIRKFTLNEFFTWNKKPVQMIDWTQHSDVNLIFGTSDGKLIDTKNFYFATKNIQNGNQLKLIDTSVFVVQYILPIINDSVYIVKSFKLRNGSYKVDCEIELHNLGNVIANYEYQVSISSPSLTEANSVDEAGYSHAFVNIDSKVEMLDASKSDEAVRQNYLGQLHWIAIRNKYFMNAIIPKSEQITSGAYIEGMHKSLPDEGQRKNYSASIKVKYDGRPVEKSSFILYLGPIEYNILKDVHDGLEKTMDLGWSWLVRPISEYFMLPLFNFLHTFIPNYGVVIIIFSIIIKIILHPLTKSSMDSMRKMQQLQPIMTELKEKYKDDSQKMNTETMKLYKDYGINPLGGCLPLLLQMPILYALFKIFGSTIQLRQASFVLWIQDLSIPDTILHLPFKFPIFGFTQVSGLALLMGITMFIQQKQSVKDPRQKSMIYMMPVLFTLMFNGFPSGLNLYYFMFNILSIGQQYFLTKKTKDVPLQKVKKKSNKKSWSERSLAALQQKTKNRMK